MNACFHCAEPLANSGLALDIDGERREFCCAGCLAVAQMIHGAGLDDFYRFRREPSARPVGGGASQWAGFNETEVLNVYAPATATGERRITLQLDNVRCAACSWLVEQTLNDRAGVCEIRLNPVTARARLRWRQEEVALADLLATLDTLGFKPTPLRPGQQQSNRDAERKRFLKRLAVAGLGMMQVMMYGIAMYMGAFEDMDNAVQQFLRYVSLLIATPVVVYAAAPFFQGAWRDLLVRRPGMDVPVALAIGGAYAASIWHTFAGSGEVYFDSVSMFVFLLLLGRFVEFSARHEVAGSQSALACSLPALAERFDDRGGTDSVPLTQLVAGDRVRVRHGETVPADGVLFDTAALLDEALLNGEAEVVTRKAGDTVLAGAINRGAPFTLRVTRIGADTLLSGITRLLDDAQYARPRLARTADRLARWFVAGVLLAAAITALAWWNLDAEHAFEITLSVLVVTCPCALALAAPVALTAATGALASRGMLTVNGDALENLAGITDVVFDKTGTLTLGKPRLRRCVVLGKESEQRCLALAAALEAQANHPIAEAFREHGNVAVTFENVVQTPGAGIEGHHAGRHYRIGTADFARPAGATLDTQTANGGSWILLADDSGPLARFELEDRLRDDAAYSIERLQSAGLEIHLLSGDASEAVHAVADALGIAQVRARQTPAAKLARVRELQAAGKKVLMIGDGINDAPVLAGADVSVAMAQGAALAQAGADFVLTGALSALPNALQLAQRTRRIMRQNLAWALAYNLLALPLAAAGLVAPWMAAIGMSTSSLLVTLNALRLRRAAREPVAVSFTPDNVIAGVTR